MTNSRSRGRRRIVEQMMNKKEVYENSKFEVQKNNRLKFLRNFEGRRTVVRVFVVYEIVGNSFMKIYVKRRLNYLIATITQRTEAFDSFNDYLLRA